jgi:two-component system, NarL family, nitrate/nitrite response regulator NarL
LVAKGKTNKHIAVELNITESTVKVHVKNLLKKLCLRSRVEAALWAVEKKVV